MRQSKLTGTQIVLILKEADTGRLPDGYSEPLVLSCATGSIESNALFSTSGSMAI